MRAPKAVRQAIGIARFGASMHWQRAQIVYAARRHGDLLARLHVVTGHTDPYPVYEQMRAQGPLLPTRLGNLSTTSHAACSAVLRSRSFAVTSTDAPRPNEGALDLSLLQLNPPDHTRLRRLAAPAFTPRRMAGYEALVDKAIHRLLDDLGDQRSFDLVPSFAAPLPIAVITHLLGLPDEPEKLRRLGSVIAGALDGVWSLRQAQQLMRADRELRSTFAELIARCAADPGDDLTSVLVAEQGDAITPEELGPLVILLLVAGFETTVNAIGSGMRWLLANPDQWQLLVEDPTLAPAVVEEVLRYDAPVQMTARVALADTEVAGVPVPKDQWLLTLLGGANRDPDAFSDPDRFDVTRTSKADHLAFSGGIHYCLGAPLARMELAAAFRALAERYPAVRSAGPVTMRRGFVLRGPIHLPVTVG